MFLYSLKYNRTLIFFQCFFFYVVRLKEISVLASLIFLYSTSFLLYEVKDIIYI